MNPEALGICKSFFHMAEVYEFLCHQSSTSTDISVPPKSLYLHNELKQTSPRHPKCILMGRCPIFPILNSSLDEFVIVLLT